ncbi:MFS transporter [Micromonospora sp. WMMD1082]|uniref:MFS transporter n=1 Tax=Micromonospora sp. WMMD1082 TaxID=3016104 RepID=UPI0024163CD5|nr:MFS transporter [Micromonospora sp. WMMD1082]MDG4798347.1 MFS transporter [Micromonospora sp. WMMD1082]
MPASPTPTRTARHQVGPAVAFATIMVVASLMQFGIGALSPFLTAEFDLSRSQLGIVTSAYYLAAAALSPVMGHWVGALGARRAMLLTIAFAAIGAATLAAATTLLAVMVAVVVAGAAAAVANPATNLAIAARPQPHAVLIGVKQSGVQAAALLTGISLPAIALATTWRYAVLATAGACLLTLPATRAAGASRPRRTPVTIAAPDPPAAASPLRRLAVFSALMGAGMATINTYLVLYAHEQIGLSAGLAGALLATIGLCAVISRINVTLIVERTVDAQRAGLRTLRMMALVGALAAGLILAGAWVGPMALWAGTVVIGLTAAAFNSVAMFVVIRAARGRDVARSSGRIQGSFFAGLFLSPPLFGMLVDASGDYTVGWLWTIGCFACAAGTITRWRARHRANTSDRALI